jgi:hypothetical protein
MLATCTHTIIGDPGLSQEVRVMLTSADLISLVSELRSIRNLELDAWPKLVDINKLIEDETTQRYIPTDYASRGMSSFLTLSSMLETLLCKK